MRYNVKGSPRTVYRSGFLTFRITNLILYRFWISHQTLRSPKIAGRTNLVEEPCYFISNLWWKQRLFLSIQTYWKELDVWVAYLVTMLIFTLEGLRIKKKGWVCTKQQHTANWRRKSYADSFASASLQVHFTFELRSLK